MGLTDRRKTSKNLVESRKKLTHFNKFLKNWFLNVFSICLFVHLILNKECISS